MAKPLEHENTLLRILAEGCRNHPAYRARRRPGVAGCETCDAVYEARRALDALDANTSGEAA